MSLHSVWFVAGGGGGEAAGGSEAAEPPKTSMDQVSVAVQPEANEGPAGDGRRFDHLPHHHRGRQHLR